MSCARCGGRLLAFEELTCINRGRRYWPQLQPETVVPHDMQGEDLTDRSPLTLEARRVRHTERQRRYRAAKKERATA